MKKAFEAVALYPPSLEGDKVWGVATVLVRELRRGRLTGLVAEKWK